MATFETETTIGCTMCPLPTSWYSCRMEWTSSGEAPGIVYSPLSSILGQRLFSIPVMADRLTHRMRELTNTVFQPQFVDGVFSNAHSRLRERLVLEGREAELPPVQRAVDSTRQRIQQRMAAFAGQRYQPPQPGEFDNEGRMHLTEWSSTSPEQEGPATRIEADEGSSVFRITASAAEGRTSLKNEFCWLPASTNGRPGCAPDRFLALGPASTWNGGAEGNDSMRDPLRFKV